MGAKVLFQELLCFVGVLNRR